MNLVGWFDRRPDMTTPLAPDMRCTSHALCNLNALHLACSAPYLLSHAFLVRDLTYFARPRRRHPHLGNT